MVLNVLCTTSEECVILPFAVEEKTDLGAELKIESRNRVELHHDRYREVGKALLGFAECGALDFAVLSVQEEFGLKSNVAKPLPHEEAAMETRFRVVRLSGVGDIQGAQV